MMKYTFWAAVIASLASAGGCKTEADEAAAPSVAAPTAAVKPATAPTLELSSTVVKTGEQLPAKYRCKGPVGGPTGPNPPLAWKNAPAETRSFALLLRDRTYRDYQHWTVYDIPASAEGLSEGVPVGATTIPRGAKQVPNSAGLTGPGYYGPCGQRGTNTYEFKLYALDVESLPDAEDIGSSLESALEAHDLATASLTVTSSPP